MRGLNSVGLCVWIFVCVAGGGMHAAFAEGMSFEEKVVHVEVLLKEAGEFSKAGRYDEANKLYDEVLKLDRYNQEARKGIRKVEQKKFKAMTARFRARREDSLAKVDELWSTEEEDGIGVRGSEKTRIPKLLKRLEQIYIPEIHFHDAGIREVAKFLSEESRKADPSGKGVNIVVKLRKDEEARVTFSMKHISLAEALDIVSKTTDLRVMYEEYAVLITSDRDAKDVLAVEGFVVAPHFFDDLKGSGALSEDVKGKFEERGVVFPEGSSASYFPNTSRLVVRATPDTLDFIRNLLVLERKPVPQVQIETKFVEFSEDKLDLLRFRWQVSGGNGLPPTTGILSSQGGAETGGLRGIARPSDNPDGITAQSGIAGDSLDTLLGMGLRQPNTIEFGGVLSGHGARLLMDLIHSVAGGNLMSAPKITLRKGASGTVRIAREFVYPSRYSTPELVDDDSRNVIPSNPEDFNFDHPKNVGVLLQVKVSDVNEKTGLIDLRLEDVQVVDFDGFINYGQDVVSLTSSNQSVETIQGVALQPIFSVRRAQTSVQLLDGQTLVMGGFIRDDVQKVDDRVPLLGDLPLLGHLFRSQGEQTVKRNMMIMVTAHMLDGAKGSELTELGLEAKK